MGRKLSIYYALYVKQNYHPYVIHCRWDKTGVFLWGGMACIGGAMGFTVGYLPGHAWCSDPLVLHYKLCCGGVFSFRYALHDFIFNCHCSVIFFCSCQKEVRRNLVWLFMLHVYDWIKLWTQLWFGLSHFYVT